MNRYLEKKIRKYVIATMDIPTMYLYKTVGKEEYCFVDDIEAATKTRGKSSAEFILRNFYLDTKLIDKELVIVPIEITYDIIED